ncbi:NUDIX domain-containing protein [Ancrocorticia sp.]|uniref:NUDIX domain-containing protein n=1 Tax=Ancrocorticia sp. TaxID=2593684 RepID=UPI003F92B48E
MSTQLADVRDSNHARITGRTEPFTGHIFGVVADDIELQSNGAAMTREFIRHDDAVGILAVRERDNGPEVLLIRQYRHPVQSVMWEIPAGLLDVAGEAPEAAAARELAEETDHQAATYTPLASYYTSPGCSDEQLHVYLAQGVTATDHQFVREDEEAEIETKWFPVEDVVAAVLAGDLKSPSLVVGILAYVARQSRNTRP